MKITTIAIATALAISSSCAFAAGGGAAGGAAGGTTAGTSVGAGTSAASPGMTVATGASTRQSSHPSLNPGDTVLSVPFSSDSIDPVRTPHADGVGRSPLWRTAIHEASHICAARFQNLDVAGSTLVGYQGLTWSSGSKRALGKAAYDSDGSDAQDAVATRVADNVSKFMTGAGEDAVTEIYSIVQAQVIDLMAGGAGEMVFLGDAPPMFMASDVLSANALAGIICRSAASQASFIEHCYQEGLAIIEANKPVVIALPTALIDHPERTLNSVEIDQCTADTLNREAQQAEIERRAEWTEIVKRAAEFSALENCLSATASEIGGKADVAQSSGKVAV